MGSEDVNRLVSDPPHRVAGVDRANSATRYMGPADQGYRAQHVEGVAVGEGVVAMTATKETQSITDALALIDRGLADVQRRNLITSDEVSNLLLDVRLLLAATLEHDALN